MEKTKLAVALSILILISSLTIFIKPATSQQTTVKVDPSLTEYYTKATGQQFTIAVEIVDVENLYGFDIKLRWNTTCLEYVSHSIRIPKNTYLDGVLWNPILPLEDVVDTDAGTYWIAYSSLAPAPSFSGSGTVFTITFEVKYQPVQPEPDANIMLELYSADLAAEGGAPIDHTTENGTVILHALPPVSTYLFVQPTVFRKSQGVTFTANVSIENVTDLYAFDISLYYNTTLLDALSVAEGPFLKSVGDTITVISEVNDTEGRVRMAIALLGAPAGADGSGTLFTITFKSSTETVGPSSLSLQNTELSNYNAELIDHAVIDGQVTILLVEILTHIVEVEGVEYMFVTASSSAITDFKYNHTQKIINFNATGPEDILGFTNITIPKALLILPANDTFIVIYDEKAIYHTRTENETHYFLYFTYAHTARPIETEIKRTLIGDLNGDRIVNIYDVVIVAIAYDATPADARWNPLADLAAPWNKITITDVVMVTRVYNKAWTP
ncbi:MAG: cohesin domain-containing protein [Candidatus Bathyarchaeia archaeon]